MTAATGGTRTTTTGPSTEPRSTPSVPRKSRHIVLYTFLTVMAVLWLFPIAWAILNSFRDYDYTSTHGYVSFGGFTVDNYVHAWQQGDFGRHFLNSVIITVPALVVTLLLASCAAFVLSRFSFWFNL